MTSTNTTVEIIESARARMAEKEGKAKAARAAQQAARVVLADGLSELAKQCRKFVSSHGEDAEEATAQLVLALLATAESASNPTE